MATPAVMPLNVLIGDTCSLSVTLQDSAGAAINISGRTYAAQIRSTADSSTVIATFNCAVVGNGSTGQFVCTIPAGTTAALTPGTGVYDVQETNSTVVTTLVGGPVNISQDVTR